MPDSVDAWHLDKKVSLALITGLAVNAVFGIWYASKLDSRVTSLEQQEEVTRSESTKIRESVESGKERLIRVEVMLETILGEIKGLKGHVTENKVKGHEE